MAQVAEPWQTFSFHATYAAEDGRLFSTSVPKENAYFNTQMSDASYPHCDMIQEQR
jgi:hypothetical protein